MNQGRHILTQWVSLNKPAEQSQHAAQRLMPARKRHSHWHYSVHIFTCITFTNAFLHECMNLYFPSGLVKLIASLLATTDQLVHLIAAFTSYTASLLATANQQACP
eukprot:1159013-Pelagomonas_calceolata.AAC.2